MIEKIEAAQRTVETFLRAHEAQLLEFTRDLIATPSPTPPGDERAVAKRIVEELETLGLGVPRIIAAQPERPNLSLTLSGAGPGQHLIYCGHMDTKPAGDREQWQHDPFDPVISDGHLYGLGSGDMKSAVTAMVYAAAALAEVRDAWHGQLELLLTADEEGGSQFGAKFLAENNHVRGDVMLIGESSGIRRELEYIGLESRGVCCFRIRTHGDQMHSSLSDEFRAVNASVQAAELLVRFAREFQRPGLTVNPGVTLQGGVYFGVVPGLAEFGCDLRVPPGSIEQDMRAEVEGWLDHQKKLDPVLRAEVVWEKPPSPWIEPVQFPHGHPFAAALEKACALVLPAVPPVGCFPAATDAPWFVAAGVPTIPAFGPGLLPLAHSPNERVEVASIHACARIYALAALRYLFSTHHP